MSNTQSSDTPTPDSECEYNVTFAVDGNLSVFAFSAEHAERQAIDALQGVECMDSERFEVEGCTVKVTARLSDTYDMVDRRVRVVEFAT